MKPQTKPSPKFFYRHFVYFFLFFFSAGICSSVFAQQKQTAEKNDRQPIDTQKFQRELSEKIRKYTLPNGIRVILMKNGSTPTVAAYIKWAVGSANEPFDLAGTAHFLEHLLFKGTETLGTLDFNQEKIYLQQIQLDGNRADNLALQLRDPLLSPEERKQKTKQLKELKRRRDFLQDYSSRYVISEEDSMAYAQAGQRGYNAYTSTDLTSYQVQLPSNRLKLWAFLESNRFIKPVFREYYSERKVVMEEKRMRYDSRPSAQLYQLFLATAFGFSPYGKPVIGFASNIPVLSQENTEKFFYENYIPARMVLTLVGDVDFEKTLALLKDTFGKIPKRPLPPFVPISQEQQKGQRIANLETDLPASPMLITGWSKPSIFHPDHAALEVLEQLLTGGQTSRLVKRMVLQEKIASGVSAYNGNPGQKLNNNFTVFVETYREKDYQRAEEILQEELQKLLQEGATQEELDKIKNNYLAYLIKSIESNSGLADSLSYYETVRNDYSAFFHNLQAVEKITSADIQRVIKTYFLQKNNTTVYLHSTFKK